MFDQAGSRAVHILNHGVFRIVQGLETIKFDFKHYYLETLQETQKVVKRSNSQLRHKNETKPSVVLRNGEFFEQIDSGWTSRDSSSMDR